MNKQQSNNPCYVVFNDDIYKTNRRGGWSKLNEVEIHDFIEMLEGVSQKKMQKKVRKTFTPISHIPCYERNRMSQEEIDELLAAIKAYNKLIERRRKESEEPKRKEKKRKEKKRKEKKGKRKKGKRKKGKRKKGKRKRK